MQVSFNHQQNNQQFGMAMKVTPEAKELLRARKMSDADIDKLGKLIDEFKQKAVSVTIDKRGNDLTGSVWLEGKHSSDYTEGFFCRLFRSPIKFIENVCNKGKKVDNHYNHNKLDEILK